MKKESHIGYKELYNNLIHESERGCLLIGFEYLVDSVQDLIISHISQRNFKMKDLFTGFGPLSTASSKIKIGYAFGFIDEQTYKDLEQLRDIRNTFAHSKQTMKLSDEWVIQKLKNIPIAKKILEQECSIPKLLHPHSQIDISERVDVMKLEKHSCDDIDECFFTITIKDESVSEGKTIEIVDKYKVVIIFTVVELSLMLVTHFGSNKSNLIHMEQ